MKIAIAFKEDKSQLEFILHSLNIRNFEVQNSSNEYTYWIYDLKIVQFFKDYIQIEKKDLQFLKINLENIEYFEVHSDKE